MGQSVTVDKILDAAEMLFAERGFAETSLRMITSRAKVNLAAVNYHFGSKNALIRAVFTRFLQPYSEGVERELEVLVARRQGQPADVEDLLAVLVRATLSNPNRSGNGLAVFMRLIGLAYTQSQGHLRRYLEQEYSKTFRRFMRLLKEATSELNAVERFWRIQFMLGSMSFAVSSSDALSGILENELGVKTSVEQIVARLVPFISAGLKAPASNLPSGLPAGLDALPPTET